MIEKIKFDRLALFDCGLQPSDMVGIDQRPLLETSVLTRTFNTLEASRLSDAALT